MTKILKKKVEFTVLAVELLISYVVRYGLLKPYLTRIKIMTFDVESVTCQMAPSAAFN